MDVQRQSVPHLSRRGVVGRMGAAGAGFAAAGGLRVAAAQESTAAVTHPLVGVWRVTSPDPDGPTFGMAVYHGDGTMVFAVPTPAAGTPASDALVFQSPAYGVWEPTGERSAEMTGMHMDSDAQGTFIDTWTFSAAVEVDDDGEGYSLDATFEIADLTGTVLSSAAVSTRGVRFHLQPMAPAAGTATPSS